MTFLEKMREKCPGMSEEIIIENLCPDEVQLEGTSPCAQANFSPSMDKIPCSKCWSREMPHD